VATFTRLTPSSVDELLFAYDLGSFVALEGIPAGSVNSNYALTTQRGRWFVRLYEEQGVDGATREAALLTRLAGRGVPTPRPLERRDGGQILVLEGKPGAVFPWRAGGMRCQAAVTPRDAEQVGAALAKVHAAGRAETPAAGRFRADDLRERLARIEREAPEDLAVHAAPLRASLDAIEARRATVSSSAPRGLVHGDLFRDNVLFGPGGDVTALLDFESACEGALVFDLMVTVLAWCVGASFDPDLARAMARGYTSVRPLGADERAAVHAEASFAALRFTVTRITDYAMRPPEGRVMKDWRRFFDRLRWLEATPEPALLAAMFGDPA